ncbi:MAG: MFS transporter [Actinomycetota bacterium]|nr:MFS transporter [Actinomycetota bacterium]
MARTDIQAGPPGEAGRGDAHRWWTLGLVCVSIFMLLLDITVVNVALPTIRHDLHATFTDLQWVIDAYALALAVLVLNAGALSDILGRKRIFIVGVALFSLSSLACGLAPTSEVLIVFRGIQGIGGAIMFSTSLALINHAFPPRERGTAFGIWGATTGLAVAIGPLIGGVLTTSAGWRWIFFVNVPIGIVAALLSVARLTESRDPSNRRIDFPGLVTLSAGLGLTVYALLRGNAKGWTSPFIVGLFVGGAVLLGLFLLIEARSPHSMVDLKLFRIPAFTGAQLVAFALSASMFSMFLYLTLYLQNVLGFSALGAGLRLMPVSILIFVFAPIAGRLSSVLPVRLLMGAGLVLISVGLLLMSGLTPQSTWTALLAGFVLAGAGVGMVNAPLASTAVAVAPGRQAGMASGVNNTFRQVGIATGIAALGAIFQSHVQSAVTIGLAGTPAARQAGAIGQAVTSGSLSQLLRRLPGPVRARVAEVARSAFVGGLNDIFVVGAIVALAGAVVSVVFVRARDFHRPEAPAGSGEHAAAVAGSQGG